MTISQNQPFQFQRAKTQNKCIIELQFLRVKFNKSQSVVKLQRGHGRCCFNLNTNSHVLPEYLISNIKMGLDARKPVFGGSRTTKAQTSLGIRAV